MSHPQDIKPDIVSVSQPVALAASHAHMKPTESTCKEEDDVISIPSSPPATSVPACSYPLVTQEMYEARWGSHDPHHVRRAITVLRELVNFDLFRDSELCLTADERRVLEVLEACLTGDSAYWLARDERRPRIRAEARESVVPAIREKWESALKTVRRARREGRTLSYRKKWRFQRLEDGEIDCELKFFAELRDAEPGKGAGPYDHIDAVGVVFDYAASEAFAAAHGALDEFEFGTLCLLKRHTVYWQRDVWLKKLIAAKEKSDALEEAAGKRKLSENKTVVRPRRKVKG